MICDKSQTKVCGVFAECYFQVLISGADQEVPTKCGDIENVSGSTKLERCHIMSPFDTLIPFCFSYPTGRCVYVTIVISFQDEMSDKGKDGFEYSKSEGCPLW